MSQAKPRRVGTVKNAGWAKGETRSSEHGDATASKRLGSYLRQLREGYGYTLRKVEERALAIGESIDNSQLSRFEKGKAIPSFDKLRALAKVFNVTVQNFSDVLDLEEYSAYKPDSGDYDELLRTGTELFTRGEHGRAFAAYDRALEVAGADEDSPAAAERIANARWHVAAALKGLGKLSLTETELRAIFKNRQNLGRRTQLRCLLELSHVHRQRGDLYLAGVLCKECLELAVQDRDLETQGRVLNALGGTHHDDGEPERALGYFERALEILESLGSHKQKLTVLTNLGGCLVSVDRFEEGVAKLREAHATARSRGYRRVAALSLNRLAEAFFLRGDYDAAHGYLIDCDALAVRPEETYNDILFGNAYLRWQMARKERNATGEHIAFGQLRRLRSRLERKFPEVEQFDEYVAKTRRSYA